MDSISIFLCFIYIHIKNDNTIILSEQFGMIDIFVRIHIHVVEVYGIRTEDKIIQC